MYWVFYKQFERSSWAIYNVWVPRQWLSCPLDSWQRPFVVLYQFSALLMFPKAVRDPDLEWNWCSGFLSFTLSTFCWSANCFSLKLFFVSLLHTKLYFLYLSCISRWQNKELVLGKYRLILICSLRYLHGLECRERDWICITNVGGNISNNRLYKMIRGCCCLWVHYSIKYRCHFISIIWGPGRERGRPRRSYQKLVMGWV